MRYLITSLLCFCLAVPTSVFANPFMDAAKQTVAEMNRAADNFVEAKIQQDIHAALRFSMQHLMALKSTDAQIVQFQTAMNDLQKQFELLLNNPNESYEVTREAVQKAVTAYTAIYSATIDQSWVPLSIDRQYESVPGILKNSLNHLKDRCAAGDWSADFDMAIRMGDALPKYEFDYSIYIGLNGDLSRYNYTPHNYIEDAKVLAALNTASGVALTTSSIYAGPAIYNSLTTGTGYYAGAAAGSTASVMLTVFPYAVAAVVVMAVISGISASRKKAKMAKQRLEADYYKLNNTRRSMWLKEEYKERCGDMVLLIEPILEDLKFIDQNLNKPQVVEAYYKNDIEEMRDSTKIFLAYTKAKCQTELNEEYKNKKCLDWEAYTKLDIPQLMKERKPIPLCYTKDDLAVSRKDCTLTMNKKSDEKELMADWEQLKEDIEIFEELDGGNEKAIRFSVMYARSIMRDIFVENYARFQKQVSNYVGNGIYKSRQEAFVRLQKLIAVYKNAKMAPEITSLQNEIEAFRNFSQLREEHLELVGLAIDVIFEKSPRETFFTKALELRAKLEPFYNQYAYVPEVSDLMGHFMQLENTMGVSRLRVVRP